MEYYYDFENKLNNAVIMTFISSK